jgi:hypothetical protein
MFSNPGQIAGGIGNIFGGIGAGRDASYSRDFIANLLNFYERELRQGREDTLSFKDDLYSRLVPYLGQLENRNYQLNDRSLGRFMDLTNPSSEFNSLNFFNQDPFAAGAAPGQQDYINNIGGQAANFGTLFDVASQGFQGGGWTQQYQNAFNNMENIMGGGNGLGEMSGIAQDVIRGGGANPYSNFLTDYATNILQSGGYNDNINNLADISRMGYSSGGISPFDQIYMQAAQRGLDTGGYDQTSGGLSDYGLGILDNDGRSMQSDMLSQRGGGIISQDPLMSMADVTSYAADSAGRRFAKGRENLMRQAMLRGGGGGIRSGLQNEAQAAGEEELLSQMAESIQRARMDQQGLQLNLFGQGANMLGEGMQGESARIGLGGNLAESGGGLANARLGQLLGAGSNARNAGIQAMGIYGTNLGQAEQLANQRVGTVGQLGLGGLNAANDKFATGANLFNNINNTQNANTNNYINAMGNQNQYALGLGSQARSFGQGNIDANNNILNQLMQAGQFGLARQNAQYSPQANQIMAGLGLGQQGDQNYLSGLNPMLSLTDMMNRRVLTSLGGYSGATGVNPGTSGLGGIIGGLGDIIGGFVRPTGGGS